MPSKEEIHEYSSRITDEVSARRILVSPHYLPDATFRGTIRSNPQMPGLLGLTGLDHRAHRQKVAGPFLPDSVSEMRPVFRQIAESQLPEFSEEIVAVGREFARPVALACVMRFVGMDLSNRDKVAQLAEEFFRCAPSPSPARRAILALRLRRLLDTQGRISDHFGNATESVSDCRFQSVLYEAGEDGAAAALTALFGSELIARGILGCLWVSAIEQSGSTFVDRSIIDRSIVASRLMHEVYRQRILDKIDARDRKNSVHQYFISLCPTVDQKGERRYMPFGHGPHHCLGVNLVRAIVELSCNVFLSQFHITKISSHQQEEGIVGRPGGILELSVLLRPRSHNTGRAEPG